MRARRPQNLSDDSELTFQLLFDQHGWPSRVGMTRWLVRCTNTMRNHNNPRYARNTHTVLGPDKWRWLFEAASMGGGKACSTLASTCGM